MRLTVVLTRKKMQLMQTMGLFTGSLWNNVDRVMVNMTAEIPRVMRKSAIAEASFT
jgi:hypothetical protein